MGRVKPSSSREGDLASRQIRAGGHADCSQVDVVPVPWHRARGGRSGSSVTQTRVLWMPLVGLCLLGPRLPLLLQGRSIWRKKGPRGVSEPHCGREWGRVQGDVAVGVTPAPSLPPQRVLTHGARLLWVFCSSWPKPSQMETPVTGGGGTDPQVILRRARDTGESDLYLMLCDVAKQIVIEE